MLVSMYHSTIIINIPTLNLGWGTQRRRGHDRVLTASLTGLGIRAERKLLGIFALVEQAQGFEEGLGAGIDGYVT